MAYISVVNVLTVSCNSLEAIIRLSDENPWIILTLVI
jgi:hypothetical protein